MEFVFAYSLTVLLSGCFLSLFEQYKEIVIPRNIERYVFPQEDVLFYVFLLMRPGRYGIKIIIIYL